MTNPLLNFTNAEPVTYLWASTGEENTASQQVCDIWRLSCCAHPATLFCWNNPNFFQPSKPTFSKSPIVLILLLLILSNVSDLSWNVHSNWIQWYKWRELLQGWKHHFSHPSCRSPICTSQFQACLYRSSMTLFIWFHNSSQTTDLLKNYHLIPADYNHSISVLSNHLTLIPYLEYSQSPSNYTPAA